MNCGCPQKWAIKEGYGACLIDQPENVSDIVKQTRNVLSADKTISLKIRIHSDTRYDLTNVLYVYKLSLIICFIVEKQ